MVVAVGGMSDGFEIVGSVRPQAEFGGGGQDRKPSSGRSFVTRRVQGVSLVKVAPVL